MQPVLEEVAGVEPVRLRTRCVVEEPAGSIVARHVLRALHRQDDVQAWGGPVDHLDWQLVVVVGQSRGLAVGMEAEHK